MRRPTAADMRLAKRTALSAFWKVLAEATHTLGQQANVDDPRLTSTPFLCTRDGRLQVVRDGGEETGLSAEGATEMSDSVPDSLAGCLGSESPGGGAE